MHPDLGADVPLLDHLALGPWRRRRRLERQLRDLDAIGSLPSVPLARRSPRVRSRRGGSGGERLRSLLVLGLTAVVMAGVVAVYVPGAVPDGVLPGPVARLLGREPAEPAGPGSYAFLATQPGRPDRPVAYSSCRELRVELNPAGGPPYAEELVEEAVRTVAGATGLEMTYVGRTDRRPPGGADLGSGLGPLPGRPPPALVSFADAEEVPALAGRVAGIGGSTSVGGAGAPRRYVTGQVTLDSGSFAELRRRDDGEAQSRAIVLHELGHLVGLDHVADRGELMHSENLGRLDFGPGDLAGLAALGRAGCL